MSGAARANAGGQAGLAARILALNVEALAFAASHKAETLARQWLAAVSWRVTDGHRAVARSLALEVALMIPSLLGTTAFDRLAKARTHCPPEEAAAIALLRRSQVRVARLTGNRFEDLATGEIRPLLPSPQANSIGDAAVFGRFAVTAEGCAVPAGTLVELDDEALAVARGFMQPGRRGLGHPLRCAETVYRHLVRRGMSAGDWVEPEPDQPFDPDPDPIDRLAAVWAASDGEPGPEETARARELTGPMPLMKALVCVGIAEDRGAKRLAEAYRRIAAVMIETLAAREAHGSGRMTLDRIAAEIDAAIARGDHAPETRTLFDTLCERVRLAAGRAPGAGGDLDRLVQRIRALREKTVEQGCTEHEALAAAEKVAELLDRYGLNLSELDLRQQSCEGIGVETGRKRRGPIDDCIGTIAAFLDCRVWSETAVDGTLRYIFFGLPADVQASVYLHALIALAFASETASFQAGAFYGATPSSHRRAATNSFQIGLGRGIVAKLDALRRGRDAASDGTSGRALVPIKESIIDQEMERLGLTFRRLNAARRRVIPAAFSAGREAGERFDYRPGIAANASADDGRDGRTTVQSNQTVK